MTRAYNSMPTYNEPLTQGPNTSRSWYASFQGLWRGVPPGAESSVTPGTSPFIYTAPSRGFVMISGGTVSEVDFNRSGTNYNTGLTAGIFPVSAQDTLTVTYSGAPTMIFVPQ